MILVTSGVVFLVAALVVVHWASPWESSHNVRSLWVASGISGVGVLAIGVGLALWLWRSP
jgi:hypothetical protein